MSLLKRKIHSLDPVEKLKKHRQVEHFMLIDKCLQIPNDDKLILRKMTQEEDESVISLLEKYRKQGVIKDKDMKQLQIYLRKFIQRYKLDNPKYPTIKISRGNNQSLSLVRDYGNNNCSNKRASFSFNVSMSKVTLNPHAQSHVQRVHTSLQQQQCLDNSLLVNSRRNQLNVLSKSKLTTSLKPLQRENYFGITPKNFTKNSIKQPQKLNTTYCKDEQRNYEQLIKKRKTQKLKIQANRVSVTIEKEKHSSPMKSSIGNIVKFDETKKRGQTSFIINDSLINVNNSMQIPILSANKEAIKDSTQSINKSSISIMNQSITKSSDIKVNDSLKLLHEEHKKSTGELLETISFKMKVDQSQDLNSYEMPEGEMKKMLSHQVSVQEFDDFMLMRRPSNYESEINTDKECNDVKKRLFDSSASKKQFQQIPSRQSIKNETKMPLLEIKYENNLLNKDKQQSKHEKIEQKQSKYILRGGKENFNSGQKKQDTQQLKQTLNQSLVRSQTKSISLSNINQLSTINKQNQENNEVLSFYIKSQRTANELSSQRLLEDSKTFVKSFIRERDEKSLKQSKSSRMQFSHRMEEIISGRTEKQQHQISSTISNRDKIKGTNKLAFWARIQSTINE